VASGIDNLAAAIREYCEAHANPTQAARYGRYFTEGYDAWGIDGKNPLWNEQIKTWFAQNQKLGLKGFLKLGEHLFAHGKYEEALVAIHFLGSYHDTIDAAVLPGIAKWFEAGVRNWAHTDVLCGMVLSPALQAKKFPLAGLATWKQSPLKFQRRAVPVAMLGLLKTKAKTKPLLQFVTPLMRDPEKVVQQGLGWFLREAWKRDHGPVEEFLLKHKDEAPRIIIQYATEKMKPEQKALYKAAKKRKAKPTMKDDAAGELSPDGRVRVELGYTQGRMSHEIYSPKLTDAKTGEVLLDLISEDEPWDGHIQWLANGDCTVGIRHYYEGGTVALQLRLFIAERTFSIDGGPPEPSAVIHQRIKKAFYEKTMKENPPEAGSWEEEWLRDLVKGL